MFPYNLRRSIKMKKLQKGFTLIELMIVVAIIGILAAVAIPAYQDYIVKAKLSKVQSTLDPIKLALSMYYQEEGSFPNAAGVATVSTVNAPGGGVLVAGDIWSSIGLSALPTLPNEIAALTTGGTATSLTLSLTLANIKAGTGACAPTTAIDGCVLVMTATPGATAITWVNTAPLMTNSVAKKYFNF